MNYTPNEPPRAMSAAEIEEILPHRYPFALVDKILDYTPGQWARGVKCFRRQVIPGDVLILECELIEQHGPVGIGKATAWVDGVRAANAELTFVITDA